MAILVPRAFLICAIPSLVVLLTLVWLKKRKPQRPTAGEDFTDQEVRGEKIGGGAGDGNSVGGGTLRGREEERRASSEVFSNAEVDPSRRESKDTAEEERSTPSVTGGGDFEGSVDGEETIFLSGDEEVKDCAEESRIFAAEERHPSEVEDIPQSPTRTCEDIVSEIQIPVLNPLDGEAVVEDLEVLDTGNGGVEIQNCESEDQVVDIRESDFGNREAEIRDCEPVNEIPICVSGGIRGCGEDVVTVKVPEINCGPIDTEDQLSGLAEDGETEAAGAVEVYAPTDSDIEPRAEPEVRREVEDMRQTETVEERAEEVEELQEAVERLKVNGGDPEPESGKGHHKPRKAQGDQSSDSKMSNGGTNTSAYGSASHSPTEEMLESSTVSNYSDLHSEGSSDSGNGGSEIHLPLLLEANANADTQGTMSRDSEVREATTVPILQFHEFELPQSLCGRLIGQGGRSVKLIKAKTHANISIKNHPISEYLKLCTVVGTSEDITAALAMIRRKFPESRYPDVTLQLVSSPICGSFAVPETLQLQLPEGIVCDVILSSMVNAGHFFLQQPTHPTYPSLSRLDQFMLTCYMNVGAAPEVPRPVETGLICAAPIMSGWYRSQVVGVYADSDECDIKFVDYGGFARVANSSLHQIRGDFMTLPFQASECYLANVSPVDEAEGWTLGACTLFEELAQGQILQSQIVSYSADGIPCVHLFRIQGAATTFINRELVNSGLAVWVDNEERVSSEVGHHRS